MTALDPNALADGVAIIGMTGRFPGAGDVAAFWRNLVSGVESISRFEKHELEPSVFDEPALQADPRYVAARGILEGIELFDADFFGISPVEARILDPQQRLFLEASWEALERAGYDPAAFRGSIGVFAGMSNNTYGAANLQATADRSDLVIALQTMMGNEKDYLATRVSYKLDLRGPSISVQTACSTSLVAVCQAVQSLLAYQCDMALAGGVSVMLPQRRGYVCYDGAITSPDGHCRAFDAQAQGTVFSNGLGIVVLKRLADAVADRDRVCAVIKGAALNNDGSAKVSFLAPSVDGHAEAVAMAQAFAGVDARSVAYVEAHGTGTSLGDVVEVSALTQAFRAHTNDTGYCALGSVKTNIGHLDAAAGVAGLIKAALAVQHNLIPPTLHFNTPNPKLSLDTTPFFVNTTPMPWPEGSGLRRAGVSSLGVGGTNAHVVIEQAPRREPSSAGKSAELLVISARTAAALERATENIRELLAGDDDTPLPDIAYTLQVGRRRFAYRRAVVCRDRGDAVRALSERPNRRVVNGDLATSDAAVGFMFPSENAPLVARGHELYQREPAFRQAIDECAAAVRAHFNVDLCDLLYGSRRNRGTDDRAPIFAHATLFAVEYAFARLWMHWGIKPRVVIGSGLGELVAAAVAGVFSLDDAMRLAVRRAEMAVNDRMDVEALATHVRMASRKAPEIELASGATGESLTARQVVDPEYWASSLRHQAAPVQLARLSLPSPIVLINIDPTIGAEGLQAARKSRVAVVPTLREGRCDLESMLQTFARLWVQGVEVNWQAFHDGETRARVPLPTYPFERERHWVDAKAVGAGSTVAQRDEAAVAQEMGVAQGGSSPALASLTSQKDGVSRLVELFSQLSGVGESELHPACNFFELGLDSLFLTRAASSIQKSFGVKVTFRELLEECNTIDSLAARLNGSVLRDAAAPPPASLDRQPAREPRAADQAPRTHGPFRPIEKTAAVLTDEQSRALDEFVGRYTAATRESKRMTAASRAQLADPRTVSGFRPLWKELVYPIVVSRASGSHLWDVDGNEYIDLVNGFGTNLFGHTPAFVTAAIEAELKSGMPIGPQSPLAGSVASQVCEMTGHERAGFCNTGSEAVTAAIRTARTVTGRDTIAMFSGAYHGIFDEVLARAASVRGEPRAVPIAPGIPESAYANIMVLEYGSASALDIVRARRNDIAAVLVEPIQSRRPELQPIQFLRDLRQVTADTGAALVFDEVVTGFRVHPGGVQALYGIKPDLATYGKVLGGGLPLGIIAGKGTYLDALDGGQWEYGDQSFPTTGMTFFAGTFVRHPLALAAASAVLRHLKEQGPDLQRGLNLRTTDLVNTLSARAADLQAPVTVTHFSSWFCFNFANDAPHAALFYAYMRSKGVHTYEGRVNFVSTAHTEADLARIVDAFTESLREMIAAGLLPVRTDRETPPLPGARRGKRPDGREAWFLPDPDRPGRYLEVSGA